MKLTFIMGTRPEIIKLSPLILEAQKQGHKTCVVFTGQHREMGKELLDFFGINADINLDIMSVSKNIVGLSSHALQRLENQPSLLDSDYIVVQGDTTSTFVGAYWAYCRKIKIIHVEAGLRTHNINAPFPEEGNRQLTSPITNLHFPPTEAAKLNLLNEGINKESIHVVGNTGIDAIHFVLDKIKTQPSESDFKFLNYDTDKYIKLVLVTAHRRESFGQGMLNICKALKEAKNKFPDHYYLYPVHPNPQVKEVMEKELANEPHIKLIEPLGYVDFVKVMNKADIILTDSGGVQEEAPSLAKPIVVLREETERQEGVDAGFAKLVGTTPENIFAGLTWAEGFTPPSSGNPYGDGTASKKILDCL